VGEQKKNSIDLNDDDDVKNISLSAMQLLNYLLMTPHQYSVKKSFVLTSVMKILDCKNELKPQVCAHDQYFFKDKIR
jgi:hypothetical protein